jgi:hypothetical protein
MVHGSGYNGVIQGYTNSNSPGAHVTKFCSVAANICGFTLCNLLYVILMTDLWKICEPLLSYIDI